LSHQAVKALDGQLVQIVKHHAPPVGVRFPVAVVVEMPDARFELRHVINPRANPEKRLIPQKDMDPGQRDHGVHVVPVGVPPDTPPDQDAAAGSENPLPLAYDGFVVHHVFQDIETNNHVYRLVRDGNGSRTFFQNERQIFLVGSAGPGALDAFGGKIHTDDRRGAMLSAKQAERTGAASEIQNAFILD